jgi:stage III sporulation protein SpoIIIAA
MALLLHLLSVLHAGTGKTTLLRDIARLMSLPPQQGGLGLAVIIVDTSNEIAGTANTDVLSCCWLLTG